MSRIFIPLSLRNKYKQRIGLMIENYWWGFAVELVRSNKIIDGHTTVKSFIRIWKKE